MALRSLTSEWFGFDGNSFVPAKSFGSHLDLKWAPAYDALFYLLGDFEDSNNIIETKPTSLTNTAPLFLELIVFRTLRAIIEKLEREIKPSYEIQSDSVVRIKGKIDFAKSLDKHHGLRYRHVCTFPELKHNDPILMLIKYGSRLVSDELSSRLNIEPRKQLLSIVDRIQHLLRDTREPLESHQLAHAIISSSSEEYRLKSLLPETKILSHFVLTRRVGLNVLGKLGTNPGILLNLNRPFEKLIRDSLLATELFFPCRRSLNEIHFANDSKSAFQMRPDCRGFVKMFDRFSYLMLDAKHKIMSIDKISSDNEPVIENQINRADLYQICTYAQTDKIRIHPKYRKKAIALVGLHHEDSDKSDLIRKLPAIEIDFGQNGSLTIARLTVSFGQALLRLGRSIRSSQRLHDVKKDIGLRLLENLFNK